MPIEGKFYTAKELRKILAPKGKERASHQAIHALAKYRDWLSLHPGTYCAEQVEEYLMGRNIDPALLPVQSFHSEYEKEMVEE